MGKRRGPGGPADFARYPLSPPFSRVFGIAGPVVVFARERATRPLGVCILGDLPAAAVAASRDPHTKDSILCGIGSVKCLDERNFRGYFRWLGSGSACQTRLMSMAERRFSSPAGGTLIGCSWACSATRGIGAVHRSSVKTLSPSGGGAGGYLRPLASRRGRSGRRLSKHGRSPGLR